MDYRLNLFSTEFSLAETHADKTPYLAVWESPAVVDALHREAAGRELFLLHDGPPYANGGLHLGHFVNKALKDALLKFQRLEGRFAPFVPGFDCHGLPVELEVERQGVAKSDPVAFVSACRAYAAGQVAAQTDEFRSFGVAADWQGAYRTMDPAFEAGAARYFQRLSPVSKRLRPVHWCPRCGSSLAEAEVEYRPKQSDSVVVLFPLLDEAGESLHKYLQVWTTTPYTLPANQAVAYHPTFDYVEVTDGDRVLVRARQEDDSPALPLVSLAGCQALSPWTQAAVPLVPADYVTSAGTGLVHLAPSFGLDDFRVGERYGLPVRAYVDAHGRYLEGALTGMSLAEAGSRVLADLGSLVYRHERLEHEYPHCWRHKSPLFFRASEEWFLDLETLRPAVVRALAPVEFLPVTGRERLTSMLESRTSWCLSRHRLWGSPLAERGADDGRVAKVAAQGLSAWHATGARRTLDVWFDSGVTHALVMRERFGRSADVYLEGSDQHRGWFQSSLLTSVSVEGEAPFRQVVTHGFVVDSAGHKYSKSSRNYQPMAELLKRHSPDVLRLWALSQDYTRDLRFSPASLAQAEERYRKFRNTLRFCLQNTEDFLPEYALPPTDARHLQCLAQLRAVQQRVREQGAAYDFASVAADLHVFCELVSSDYFSALKDVLYCELPQSPVRREAQSVLMRLLEALLRLLMPLLPFTVEEVFQRRRSMAGWPEESALLLTWESASLAAPEPPEGWAQLVALKADVNRYVEAHRDTKLRSPAQLEVHLRSAVSVNEREAAAFLGVARLTWQFAAQPQVAFELTHAGRCPRCRRHEVSVQANGALCLRCSEVEQALGH